MNTSSAASSKHKLPLPERAVITGGMPYGNKELHFGHVGGMFVQADVFARFLRDRIGKENVLFVSGTDCYGSPVVEYHRQICARGEFDGDLNAFVNHNHKLQKEVLDQFDISLDIFAASGLGRSSEIHHSVCQDFLRTMHKNGHLTKLSSSQFYDQSAKALLNGRQVVGRCPVPGCPSEKAYADECALGHPYEPKDLIAPRSTLTGVEPELKEVQNWYLDLPKFRDQLIAWTDSLETIEGYRPFVVSGIREFLEMPSIYLKTEIESQIDELVPQLPPFERNISRNQALRLVFADLDARAAACAVFTAKGIRFRAGKTLVPFRLTGNVSWGVPCPDLEGPGSAADSTFWVWPESLIAPISFTQTILEDRSKKSGQAAGQGSKLQGNEWMPWWTSPTSRAYQFIGEDNLYFYSLAEVGIFLAMQGTHPTMPPQTTAASIGLQPPYLVVNNHILYFDKKASSSGDIKPPLAKELLDYYSSDQLRAHFLALALGQKSVGFKPKPLNPQAGPKDSDPVLKDGNLLCNAFNKSVRTMFFTIHKCFDGQIPIGQPSEEIIQASRTAAARYEDLMLRQSFHEVMGALDTFLREINRHWTQNIRSTEVDFAGDPALVQHVIDNLHMIKVATILLHPVAPRGTELIREYLQFGEEFWSWKSIHEPISMAAAGGAAHRIKELPPRFDFFPKHPSQF
jgi:methionyl-tRNA synthetase